jgi:hypothetical protein
MYAVIKILFMSTMALAANRSYLLFVYFLYFVGSIMASFASDFLC